MYEEAFSCGKTKTNLNFTEKPVEKSSHLFSVYLLKHLAQRNHEIQCDNWKTLLFIKVYRNSEVLFNRHVLALFEISELKEVRILFFISTIREQSYTKMKNSKIKFENEALVYHTC